MAGCRWVWVAMALGAACTAPSSASEPCAGGAPIVLGADHACAYERPVVIVGGFRCPAADYRMDTSQTIVCATRNVGEGELCTALDCGVEETVVFTDGPGCDNLNPLACLLPWPSSRFEVQDETSATGRRLYVADDAMSSFRDGTRVSASGLRGLDGFSASTPIVTALPGLIDTSALASEDRIADSLLPSSPTLLFDGTTGERVAHIAEIDGWPRRPGEATTLYLRPAARLEPARRYIVALRGLRRPDGSLVEPSAAFAALREGTPAPREDIEARRPAYDGDLFPWLEAHGVSRHELVEAWDFHTGSDAHALRDLHALVRGDGPGRCEVKSVVEGPLEGVAKIVRGELEVPSYLDGGALARDATGAPMRTGTATLPFIVVVPASVVDGVASGVEPARALVLMHSFFGSEQDLLAPGIRHLLVERGFVGIAAGQWGTAAHEPDEPLVVMRDLSRFPALAERIAHGAASSAQLVRAFGAGGSCDGLDVLATDGTRLYEGSPYLLGVGSGATHALAVAAASEDVERVVGLAATLGFPTVLRRSYGFRDLDAIMQQEYPAALDRDLIVAMTASLWDLSEAGPSARALAASKPVLIANSVHDAALPDVASHVLARTMSLPVLAPAPREIWGLDTTEAAVGSAFAEIDVGAYAPPPGSAPPEADNGAYDALLRSRDMHALVDAFLRPGGLAQSQ